MTTHSAHRPVVLVTPYRRRPELFFLWIPGLVTIGWVLLTLFLYVEGPYRWLHQSHDRLIRYIAIAMFCLGLGYGLGLVKKSRPAVVERPPLRLLQISGLLTFVPLIVAIASGDLVYWIRLAWSDIGLAYRTWTAAGGTKIWPYLDIFTAPFTAPFIPVSIFHWRRLPGLYKIALAFALLVILVSTVTSGRRSGVVVILTIITASLGARAMGAPPAERRRQLLRFVLLLILFTAFMIPFLRFVAEGRAADGVVDLTYNPVTRERPEPEHILTRIVPPAWAPTFFTGVFYLTHGYYPMEMALEMPFTGITWGLGQSWFVARNAERLGVSPDFLAPAYDRRLTHERGYKVGDFWMTVFPWLASDVTFPGTWVVLGLFGFVLARVWESATTGANPWSVTFLGILAYFAFSLPMSNPMQDGSGLTRMLGVLLVWWLSTHLRARDVARRHRAAVAPVWKPASGSVGP